MENKQLSRENRKKSKEIDLKEIFTLLKKHIFIIVIITFIGGVIGYFLNQMSAVPLYQSSSRVFIKSTPDLMPTLQVIVRDYSILDIVKKQMNLNETSDELANKITVNSIDNSQVVSIAVVDTDPRRAAKIADTVANIFKEHAPKILNDSKVSIDTLSKAKVNLIPINPPNKHKLLFGIIGGMVIGIGLASLLESLEDTIRSKEDIEGLLGVPVIGKIKRINKRNLKRRANKSQQIESELRGESVDFK